MLCDLCGEREATFVIRHTTPSRDRYILNLCLECSNSHGISSGERISDMAFFSLFALSLKRKNTRLEEKKRMCPVCGTDFASVERTEAVGCPECYSFFKNKIVDILKASGTEPPYRGMLPKNLKNFHSVLADRVVLQTKLEESIKREDYERAALYRDYLKSLEKMLVSGDADE